ncbi:MAG: cupredoxin domain-containing protein [Myxococcales bacterium]|nr:cupredoxin domain-containing protein [Myxococcales bacterium]
MRLHAHACAFVLLCASSLPLAGCGSSSPAAAAADREAAIVVTAKGFEPKALTAKVGQPVTLVVTRKVERTCATEIVIKDYGIDQPLPLDQPVKVTFTPTKPGKVRFACGMDMIAGEIAVQ